MQIDKAVEFNQLIEISRQIEAERLQRRIAWERYRAEVHLRNSRRRQEWLENEAYHHVFCDTIMHSYFKVAILPEQKPPQEIQNSRYLHCIVRGGIRAEQVGQFMSVYLTQIMSEIQEQKGLPYDPDNSWFTDALPS